jgi:K+-sensing histidine kinase KdpD
MKRRQFMTRLSEKKPAMVASIAPVVAAFAAVLLTTLVLFTIQSYLATEHLLLVYLLPTILMAIYFGSTNCGPDLARRWARGGLFLLPPQFSFYIADGSASCGIGLYHVAGRDSEQGGGCSRPGDTPRVRTR